MADESEKMPLWTRDFTIITAGTVVSILGNSISGFALGLLVLELTGSTFLYALYLVMYNLPKVAVPALAGPFLDRFSRKRTICTLDFVSAGLYGFFAWLIVSGKFNYGFLVTGCLLLGTIDSIYQVAYDSFYPMLISEGNYTKAYSIQSTLESLAMFGVPVAAFLYNVIGVAPLFLANTVCFLVAAVLETQIKAEEDYARQAETSAEGWYGKTFVEGIAYLKEERGLRAVTLYFTVSSCAQGAFSALVLPWFKLNFEGGEVLYLFTMGWMVVGRLAGGAVHYRMNYPPEKKYVIALAVYLIASAIDGTVLFLPWNLMKCLCFAEGVLGVTSYNIRVSATQSYVPDGKKGRFNGIFQMATTAGLLSGQFLSGLSAIVLPQRAVLAAFFAVTVLAAIVLIGGNRNAVEKIYNRRA